MESAKDTLILTISSSRSSIRVFWVSREVERVCTLSSRDSTEVVGKSDRKPIAVKRRVASSSLVRFWMATAEFSSINS
jgi:hypothetical protein